MQPMPKEVTYSDARAHFKSYLDYISLNNEIVVINRKNNEDIVMMTRRDYESIEETLYILSSPKNRERIFKAMKNEGKGAVTLKTKKELREFLDNL
jgi:antitoxin YefM